MAAGDVASSGGARARMTTMRISTTIAAADGNRVAAGMTMTTTTITARRERAREAARAIPLTMILTIIPRVGAGVNRGGVTMTTIDVIDRLGQSGQM